MDDQKIYALMAKTPDIRAVQICDALDEDLVDVSASLRALVEVGHVVKHSGLGPNGIGAQMYNLSPEFKKSREGLALLARVVPHADASAPAPAAAAPNLAPVAPNTGPMRSKVDRAVEFVLKQGGATDDELRTVMGIAKPTAPSSYLAAAIKAGKLHKDGATWKSGRAPAPASTPPADSMASVNPADPLKRLKESLTPPPAEQQAAPEVQTTRTGSAIAETGTVPRTVIYRCALWSDGVLEVQRDGTTVAEMPQAAGESLAAFLARLASQKEAA